TLLQASTTTPFRNVEVVSPNISKKAVRGRDGQIRASKATADPAHHTERSPSTPSQSSLTIIKMKNLIALFFASSVLAAGCNSPSNRVPGPSEQPPAQLNSSTSPGQLPGNQGAMSFSAQDLATWKTYNSNIINFTLKYPSDFNYIDFGGS